MAVLHDFQHALPIAGAENTVGGVHEAIVHQRADDDELCQNQHHGPHQVRSVQVAQAIIHCAHEKAHDEAHQREIGHAAAEVVIMPFGAVGEAQSGQKFQAGYKITHLLTCLFV